ncbi:polysaccharide deacetylase family protein [Paenibacillus qinlingensis]|uniref:Peptidoglycan/xylan/chitin deacetylase (PgdA/CDA1 family) n=1 Tax=Paenibacillus qinlingensis TaxID=1837343 RepID=A0ABU1P0Y8_9BACL|nr:polysaccharide deacetylase family protein [Paenibacillus qinlingensis]MDR6553407.1 peptidoglycan/xylan/chitin deacetylase (PgdA/CDA1 family) [Paenibacillus qinlingensis]
MNIQRKRFLFYSCLAALLTLLSLFLLSGLNPSSAPVLLEVQAEELAASPQANQVEVPDFTEDKLEQPSSVNVDTPSTMPSETPPTPIATVTADTTPTPASTLTIDTPPQKPSVTTNTYMPSSSKVSIPVLNYHSVTIDPGNVVVISPAKLEAQMKYLHDHGYTPISLSMFTDLFENKSGITAPNKPVLLTFDDGYIDNVEEAMPILAKYHFPATLFMSPGMVEDPSYLNWEQVKQLQEAGWDIQPHGMTHPHLPRLSAEQQAYEIKEARRLIEEKLGTQADVFCYPYGEYNQSTLKLLKEHGFRYAFTIDQGFTTNQQSPYLLKRLFVNGEESLKAFINKLQKTN